MKTIEELIQIIGIRFQNQYRKHTIEGEKIPAVLHSYGVFYAAVRYGIKTAWVLKAFLAHDALEDTNTTVDELREMIGDKATNVVIELTYRPDECAKPVYMRSFRDKSIYAVVGKVIDRLENVDDFEVTDPNYAGKYFHKADEVFDTFYARRDEVIKAFGAEVFYNIDRRLEWKRLHYGAKPAPAGYVGGTEFFDAK